MNLTIYVAASVRHKHAVQLLQAALAEQAGAQILDWTDKAAPPAGLTPAQSREWYDTEQTGGQVFAFCADACANADLVIYYGASGGEANGLGPSLTQGDMGGAAPLSEIDAGVEVGLAAGAGVPVLGIMGPLEAPGLMLYSAAGLWVRDVTDAVDAVRTMSACNGFPLACTDCRLPRVCPLFRAGEEDVFRFGRVCRVCGCDDFHACPGGCYWVEDDLCSACAEKKEDGHDPR